MQEHLQGQGTYDYACRDKDCLYCAHFELISEPNIYQYEHPEFVPRTIKKKKRVQVQRYHHWTESEYRIIIDNIWMNNRELNKLLPKRTGRSIFSKISQLRNNGTLEKFVSMHS